MQTDGTFQQLFGMRWHGLAHLLNMMVSSAFSIVSNELQTTQRKSDVPTALMSRIQVIWIFYIKYQFPTLRSRGVGWDIPGVRCQQG